MELPRKRVNIHDPRTPLSKQLDSCHLKASNAGEPRPLSDFIENIEQFLPSGFPSSLPSSYFDGLPIIKKSFLKKIFPRKQAHNETISNGQHGVGGCSDYSQDSLGFTHTPEVRLQSFNGNCDLDESPNLIDTSLETSDSPLNTPTHGSERLLGKVINKTLNTSLETSDSEVCYSIRRSPRSLTKVKSSESSPREPVVIRPQDNTEQSGKHPVSSFPGSYGEGHKPWVFFELAGICKESAELSVLQLSAETSSKFDQMWNKHVG